MSSTPGTPKGTEGDAESGDARRAMPPSTAPVPSRGWEQQPQGAYDAVDSGGWGGPNPGPMTGPIPRIRRGPATPSPRNRGDRGDRGIGSADEREHGRRRPAPGEAAEPRTEPRDTRDTQDAQESLFGPPKRGAAPGRAHESPARPVDSRAPETSAATWAATAPETSQASGESEASEALRSAPTPTRSDMSGAPEPPEPPESPRPFDAPARRRPEPDTADLPIQAEPAAAPRGGSFSRYLLPQLLPVTFWLVIAWVVVEELVPFALSVSGGAPAGALLLQLALTLVKVAALGCLARVVLEACDRAFHR